MLNMNRRGDLLPRAYSTLHLESLAAWDQPTCPISAGLDSTSYSSSISLHLFDACHQKIVIINLTDKLLPIVAAIRVYRRVKSIQRLFYLHFFTATILLSSIDIFNLPSFSCDIAYHHVEYGTSSEYDTCSMCHYLIARKSCPFLNRSLPLEIVSRRSRR